MIPSDGISGLDGSKAAYTAHDIDRIAALAAQRPWVRAILVWPFLWGLAVTILIWVWPGYFFASLGHIALGILIGGANAGAVCVAFALPAYRKTRDARSKLDELRAGLK